jgi:hypothetical protein
MTPNVTTRVAIHRRYAPICSVDTYTDQMTWSTDTRGRYPPMRTGDTRVEGPFIGPHDTSAVPLGTGVVLEVVVPATVTSTPTRAGVLAHARRPRSPRW